MQPSPYSQPFGTKTEPCPARTPVSTRILHLHDGRVAPALLQETPASELVPTTVRRLDGRFGARESLGDVNNRETVNISRDSNET